MALSEQLGEDHVALTGGHWLTYFVALDTAFDPLALGREEARLSWRVDLVG